MSKPSNLFSRLGKQHTNHVSELEAQVSAVREALAVIEFDLGGHVLDANENFLSIFGFRLEELRGKHHRALVDPDEAATPAYRAFWEALGRGERASGRYRRFAKDGREVWLEASYNPLRDAEGKPYKVVKYAIDITASMQASAQHLRVSHALENVTTNVMIADNERRIVYMNPAVREMLEAAQSDIRKEIPGFEVKGLMGACIDSFHKNPAHQEKMLAALEDTYRTEIKLGGRTFGLIASPVFDADGSRAGTVVEWQDRTAELKLEAQIAERAEKEKAIAEDNLRVRNALDNVTTNVMIADNDRNIVYMNKSLEAMLGEVEADLRKDLPHFDVRKVMGANIDIFHKNPAHQIRVIESLRETFSTEIKVGGRILSLTLNPIVDEQGERCGTVVEWLDRTLEDAVEREIGGIVNGAARGDFSSRVARDGKTGFFERLARGMNELLDTNEQAFNEVLSILGSMAEGDLTKRITADYEGTFGQLKADANATMEKLTQMVVSIRRASESINVAAREIAAGNADLSSRTEQQAASLEETASSMEELTATVKQNAENAQQANEQAQSASAVATRGGTVVEQVVATMGDINDSSKKISDIIGVIDGIAFQTNILALNAAVEAARAGEQGRGFAVVAGEVRNLAQRSAAAAKEIKELISTSVDKIKGGTELVNKAGTTMDEILASVKRVTDIMGEITSASAEQSSGIEQVSLTVQQMDEVTQQNAALVEEASAAARSMEEQAGTMEELVQQFRVVEDGEARGAGMRKASAADKPAPQPKPAPTAAQPAAKPVAAQKPGDKNGLNGQHPPAIAAAGEGAGAEQWTSF
jgi:methyl-accepting chemotaxis protein